MNIKKVLMTTVIIPIILAVTGCGSTPEEKAAKAALKKERAQLIRNLVSDSVATCETGPVNPEEAKYIARLKEALKNVSTDDLRIYNDNVTICLDQRLAQQDNGWTTKDAVAILFPENRILSIFDNGIQPEDRPLIGKSAYKYSKSSFEELTNEFNLYNLPPKKESLSEHEAIIGTSHFDDDSRWTEYHDKGEKANRKTVLKHPRIFTKPPLKQKRRQQLLLRNK